IRLKARWRVSLQAMLRRALDLRIISSLQYTKAFKDLSSLGWRKKEPGDFEFDAPIIVDKLFSSLQKHHNLVARDVADQLDWDYSTLARIANIQVEPPPRETSATRIISIGSYREKKALTRADDE